MVRRQLLRRIERELILLLDPAIHCAGSDSAVCQHILYMGHEAYQRCESLVEVYELDAKPLVDVLHPYVVVLAHRENRWVATWHSHLLLEAVHDHKLWILNCNGQGAGAAKSTH